MVALEKRRLERTLAITGHFKLDRADPRGEPALVTPVAPAAALVGTLARLSAEIFAHLRLQELVQNGFEQRRHAAVSLQKVLDLLVVDCNLKGGHRQYVRLVRDSKHI